jgi:hypothetical protein
MLVALGCGTSVGEGVSAAEQLESSSPTAEQTSMDIKIMCECFIWSPL